MKINNQIFKIILKSLFGILATFLVAFVAINTFKLINVKAASLVNGNFETSDFTGWSNYPWSNGGWDIASMGNYAPAPEGTWFARSYSNGDVSVGAISSQELTIPSNANYLKLWIVGGLLGNASTLHFGFDQQANGYLDLTNPTNGPLDGEFEYDGTNLSWTQVQWDISTFAGQTGKFVVIDNNDVGWGFINIDDLLFIDTNTTPILVTDSPTLIPTQQGLYDFGDLPELAITPIMWSKFNNGLTDEISGSWITDGDQNPPVYDVGSYSTNGLKFIDSGAGFTGKDISGMNRDKYTISLTYKPTFSSVENPGCNAIASIGNTSLTSDLVMALSYCNSDAYASVPHFTLMQYGYYLSPLQGLYRMYYPIGNGPGGIGSFPNWVVGDELKLAIVFDRTKGIADEALEFYAGINNDPVVKITDDGGYPDPVELQKGVINSGSFPADTWMVIGGSGYPGYFYWANQNLSGTLDNLVVWDNVVKDFSYMNNENPGTVFAFPSYKTLLASDGARHVCAETGPILGLIRDCESDGQPTIGADGDDLNPSQGPDDEDGIVQLDPFIIGQQSNPAIQYTISNSSGGISCFADWQHDGNLQYIYIITMQDPGSYSFSMHVPSNAVPGPTHFRCRVASDFNYIYNLGSVMSSGEAPDGEVEDYIFNVQEALITETPTTTPTETPTQIIFYDFGDLPDTYGTTLSNNAARHGNLYDMYIGSTSSDYETDGQPSVNADGDDSNSIDDEDNNDLVISQLVPGQQIQISGTVFVGNNNPNNFYKGLISAWIDRNHDGIFNDATISGDPINGEQMCYPIFNYGINNFSFNNYLLPINTLIGTTYMRLRFGPYNGNCFTSYGVMDAGEVEDYKIEILNPLTETPTLTEVFTETPTNTSTETMVITETQTPTFSPTFSSSPTISSTPGSPTFTYTPSQTRTYTYTPTNTVTGTPPSATPTRTPTRTFTQIPPTATKTAVAPGTGGGIGVPITGPAGIGALIALVGSIGFAVWGVIKFRK